jgi:hypothetical protein
MEKTGRTPEGVGATAGAQDVVAVDRRLVLLGAVAAAVGGYFWWDTKQRQEQRVAEEAARRHAEQAAKQAAQRRAAEERQAQAERRRVEEAQRRAAMLPADLRSERLQAQFSGWDGSHRATEQAIKGRMNNPDSYDHVQTVYADLGPGRGLRVTTRFRGTNLFGALVLNTAVAEVTEGGLVTSLTLER